MVRGPRVGGLVGNGGFGLVLSVADGVQVECCLKMEASLANLW